MLPETFLVPTNSAFGQRPAPRALSRLLPAWSMRSILLPSFGPLLDLIEIAVVDMERVESFFVLLARR
jgi:hypothetical protein